MIPAPLAALRAATRDVHERLHHHPTFAPLTGVFDRAGYARLLARLHGFHVPAERWLFEAAPRLLPELDDLAARRKAHLLAGDLAVVAPGLAASSLATFTDKLTRPALLGSLYMIEGSTLGGRELGRRLESAVPEARCYLLAYGDQQGALWRRFCAVLEQVGRAFTAAELDDMTVAARDLFLRFEAWLGDGETARSPPCPAI